MFGLTLSARALLKLAFAGSASLALISCNSTKALQFKNEPQVVPQSTNETPSALTNVRLFSRSHWVVTDSKSVWRTNDAGKSWKRILSPVEQEKSRALSGGLSFIDEQTGFVVFDHKVLGTVDGGNSWTRVNDTNLNINNIFFIDPLTGWAAGRELTDDPVKSKELLYVGKLWYTSDGGKNWQDQSLPKTYMDTHADRWELKDVCFSDARNGWAVGNGVFLHTDNGGSAWKELNIRGDFSRIMFANRDLGWAVHRGFGMFELTIDGGKSWKHVEMKVQTSEVRILFVAPETAFAIENDIRFQATKDGGKKWEPATSDGLLTRIENATDLDSYLGRAKDGTLVAVWLIGNPKEVVSIVSTDNGKSWFQNQ